MAIKNAENPITLENLIKEIIKARGKTNKDVAIGLGINDKTFNGIINRPNAMKAEMLFRLSDYLGFDLEWLKNSLGYAETGAQILGDAIPRMPDKLREKEKEKLLSYVDSCIKNYGEDLSYMTDQVYSFYFRNDFYLLDILLPAGEEILEQNINRKRHYCCICQPRNEGHVKRMAYRPQVLTAQEMIARIIVERMDEAR